MVVNGTILNIQHEEFELGSFFSLMDIIIHLFTGEEIMHSADCQIMFCYRLTHSYILDVLHMKPNMDGTKRCEEGGVNNY